MSNPQNMKRWVIEGTDGFDSLKYEPNAAVPKVGSNEVLVKIHGVSLNFRDLIIPQGKYPFAVNMPVVPCSDGAGEVVQVGEHVKRFKAGDKVITLFNQKHIGGSLDPVSLETGLGGAIDGTLREYGVFEEEGLVHMPTNLNYVEASTLSCAGMTAWNALFGLEGRRLKPGDWVLTQGTGGVSLFGIQFAKATGAKVVATTGSDEKAHVLKKLGADVIINYKSNPEWGAEARKHTPGGRGFNHIIEVAGPKSMKQSLEAITIDGIISIIGFVGGMSKENQPTFLDCLSKICTVRGILVGSRVQMEEMCRAVEANDQLKPVLAPEVFTIEQAREAYEYQQSQKHFGKVCIKIT